MYEYEIDLTRTVGATERTRDAGRKDGRTDVLEKTQMYCDENTGFYTKVRPLVKSNLICPSDKLTWQPGGPVLNINIQGNFCISPGNDSSDNLPENLV